jgi:NAD(P)-dependent dehydrogenase (short-subunit alcohol dehydrogenase family)
LAFAEDNRLKKTLQNSITARFTGDWYWKTDCFVMQNLALLLTKIRSLVHEEISLLTVLYFPFRVRTPISASERHSMNTTQQPVAVVTGASSGIGLGVTQALLERGWRVVGTSRTISTSKDLKPSPELVLVDGDVSKKETAIKVIDAALKHFGRIDLLVNNAGIYLPKAFTDYTEEDYNLVMNTNVASFFYMTQQVIPQMKKQNSGHVVSISGASVDQPSGAATELLAVLSKSPMPAASKALALEYAANNIRFNTVSPGVVNTPMHAKGNHAELAKLHPLARIGEVSDVVDAVLYLQNATFVTGENIRVDGGVHAGR